MPRRRWGIACLLGLGVLVNYFDRVNLSVSQDALHHTFGISTVTFGYCSVPTVGLTRHFNFRPDCCWTVELLREPESMEFLAAVPTEWDESKALNGKIAE
ncbi:MAG: hypothetical protein WBR26_28010 [Candidatus Acidiferrum sp.]